MEAFEQAIRAVADAGANSVVSIGRDGRGSGFVVASDRVLTSAHNVRDHTVSVSFADGRTVQGQVHAVDTDGDLVVISVETAGTVALTLTEPTAEVGSAVIALSRGGHRPRATVGFVSALGQTFRGPRGRAVHGSLEHTAPLARGSSGGPVFDAAGHVIAINTHRPGDGFYLARVTDEPLRTRIAELLEGHSPQTRTLGVAVAPPHVAAQLRAAVGLAARDGLLVRGVDDDGPAGRAGVMVGDLLVALGDRNLVTIDDLQQALEVLEGDTVELRVVRGTDDLTLTVEFTVQSA